MIGILLAQIGTPVAPTPEAVKKYLRRFLSDRRIVDYPRWLWNPILEMILLKRPKKVAAAYQEIWTAEGSPLWVTSRAQARMLQERLGKNFAVELGLSYTQDDIAKAYKKLVAAGCEKIMLLPLFPEFSSSTTTAAYDAVSAAALEGKGYIPQLQLMGEFCQNKAYQKCLAAHVKEHINALPLRPDHVLISFHGIPVRYEKEGDPYRTHCELTAHTLANNMGWLPSSFTVAYQSQFGPEKWLKPSTQTLLKQLPKRGIQRLAVITPGFVSDCIETLEEIACEGRELWEQGGGAPENFYHLPCLNTSERFIEMLAGWIEQEA